MPHNPAVDFATFLAAAGLGLTLGTSIVVGMPRDVGGTVPKNAVFIHGFGGTPAMRFHGAPPEIRRPLLMLQVRNGSMLVGDTVARDILNAVAGADVSTYLDVFPSQSEPNYAGQDQNGDHFWNHSFEMVYEE